MRRFSCRKCGSLASLKQSVKDRFINVNVRWIPGSIAILSTITYVILLILFSERAKYTFQVSHMSKARYCKVDFIGHKSQSPKQTSCCEVWLGVVCRSINIMPCSSISVKYKLPNEEFERAGYINYWDPQHLIPRYAANSHCMIVPITCPEPQEQSQYTQEYANKNYTHKQLIECYVRKENPERPLVIRARLLPHVSLAVLLFLIPPLVALGALIACVVLRGDSTGDGTSTQNKENSQAVFISEDSEVSAAGVTELAIEEEATTTVL